MHFPIRGAIRVTIISSAHSWCWQQQLAHSCWQLELSQKRFLSSSEESFLESQLSKSRPELPRSKGLTNGGGIDLDRDHSAPALDDEDLRALWDWLGEVPLYLRRTEVMDAELIWNQYA